MELQTLLTTCILVQDLAYLPKVLPVDYGGTTVINLSIHLSDGALLRRSSFELKEIPIDGGMEELLSLMREEVLASGQRPRCEYLNPALTAQYRALTGKPKINCLVSACLCGEYCRYDGGLNLSTKAVELVENGQAIPICPELLGGLSAPRAPCERFQGKVLDSDGVDQTEAFETGAKRTLEIARLFGAERAVLKERSPTCGVHLIYDGTFSGKRIPGSGLTAQLLRENGLSIYSEEDLDGNKSVMP